MQEKTFTPPPPRPPVEGGRSPIAQGDGSPIAQGESKSKPHYITDILSEFKCEKLFQLKVEVGGEFQ